jgi:type IV secretion system protein VirB8
MKNRKLNENNVNNKINVKNESDENSVNSKNNDYSSEHNYFANSANWHYQIYESERVWLSRAIILIILLLITLTLSLSANFFLFPLKQNVPYLYAVNETTGELTQLGQFQVDKQNNQWLMTRFLIVRFVVNRESYDSDNLDEPYQIAWAMSDSQIAQSYAEAVRTDNEESPFALYGKNKYITVHVLAVNKLNEDTASVRFELSLHDRQSDTTQTVQKEAIIKWQYTAPITTDLLPTNPT